VIRRPVPALLAAALLGGLGPAAGAGAVRAECRFDTVASEPVTGSQERFTGVAYGVAVFDDAATHTLRCYVTVDGVERATTPAGSGTGGVVTAGQVTYDSPEGADAALCTEVDGVTTGCESAVYAPCLNCGPMDPDLITLLIDRANDAVAEYVDPVVCPLLASLSPGVPGVVGITPDGDTTVVGVGPFWDCPPYGDLFGAAGT
jgi:hypothetical protein